MKKPRLMTPGPSPVPEEVLLELARPVYHHRTPRFRAVLERVQQGLQWLLCTRSVPLVLTCSGTGAMEAVVSNLVGTEDEVLVLAAGRFGRRWAEIAARYGARVTTVEVPPGESVEPDQLRDALAKKRFVAVFATHCETSTGAAHDIERFAAIVREFDTLLAVDSVSAAGGMELRVDDWGIDALVAGSQKAFMMPPGLAFVVLSERAWERVERRATRPVFYFDLLKMRQKAEQQDTPFTPAHTLISAMVPALERMQQEGLPAIWERHRRMAAACRAAVQALGLPLFAQHPADVVTAVRGDGTFEIPALLGWLESTYGLKFAGGQDDLKGKIFRIAHMGYIDELDVLAAVGALEQGLKWCGRPVTPGQGLAAAQEVLIRELGR